jgi:uncharacterized protein
MTIKIMSGKIGVEAEFLDNPTAKAIMGILPITAHAQRWGDEIYFEIAVHVELDSSAKETVEAGDLGFWPQGDCFCIFFGPTPMSKEDEIRPASAVNVFGKAKGELAVLKRIKDGDTILIG